MKKIEIDEIIGCESYYSFCDYDYDYVDRYPTGIICCHLDHIHEFFAEIEGNDEKYVVVSPRSDFGLYYQDKAPVWNDMYKAVRMFAGPKLGYEGINLPPRCEVTQCSIVDKYSIKMYMWTKATFNQIPPNVIHWFVVNNCVDSTRVTSLPFGINNCGGGTKFFDAYEKLKPVEKTKTLYVNFQFYTNERMDLYRHFFNHQGPSTTVEKDLPFDHYMNMLNSHRFCLCPTGNGPDCYRIWECLYMKCIPIIENHPAFQPLLENLPVLFVDSFYGLNENGLNSWYDKFYDKINWDSDKIKLSYWKNKIEEQSGKL